MIAAPTSNNALGTYLPGQSWILNDTYPDRQRKQHVYLYNVASGTNTTHAAIAGVLKAAFGWPVTTAENTAPLVSIPAADAVYRHDAPGRLGDLVDSTVEQERSQQILGHISGAGRRRRRSGRRSQT